ncbi:MAG: UbiD family decarboxylase [Nitrospinota bacterium]
MRVDVPHEERHVNDQALLLVRRQKTMAEDLRGFLQEIQARDKGELIRVKREIARDFEMTALVAKLEAEHRVPVLFFEKVQGADFPVVVNCFASRSRIAAGLGIPSKELLDRYREAVEHPIPPEDAHSAPVQEVVIENDAVDLNRLPLMRYHDTDAAPYLTAGIVFAKDPDSGEYNLSFNRMMLKDRNRFGVFMTVGKHLHEIYSRTEERGEALPIAISLGNHPAWALGALYIGPYQVDELGVIGGLMKRPLEMAPARTVDLKVPARAEIILEGEIEPYTRQVEGSFAEFHGYATKPRERQVVRIKAITHRRNAIYQDILGGAHREHLVLPTVPMEANVEKAIRAAAPSTVALRIAAPFSLVVSIKKRYPGQPKTAILAALGAELYLKQVIVVDEDIDVSDLSRVLWAMATRCQWSRDTFVIPDAPGSSLDPSALTEGLVDKVGIDATAKPTLEAFSPRAQIPPEVMARLRLEDYLS